MTYLTVPRPAARDGGWTKVTTSKRDGGARRGPSNLPVLRKRSPEWTGGAGTETAPSSGPAGARPANAIRCRQFGQTHPGTTWGPRRPGSASTLALTGNSSPQLGQATGL